MTLADVLTLEQIDDFTFRGRSQPGTLTRIFGGEVAGQAVAAAGLTVPADRPVHSLNSCFLLPGDPSTPVMYRVEPTRDGGSFTTRRVDAVQHGRVIFQMIASYQRREDGPGHQVPALEAALPETLPPPEVALADEPAALEWVHTLQARTGVELRFPETPLWVILSKGISGPPRQRVWLRAFDRLPDSPQLQAAALTYVSDMLLLSTALGPHGITLTDPRMTFATVTHSVYFHAPAHVDEWFLYDQEAIWSGSGRGLCRGSILDPAGTLIATTVQEGLLRRRDVPPTPESSPNGA